MLAALVGPRWAAPLAALVYAAMVLAIAYCVFEPPAHFRYLDL